MIRRPPRSTQSRSSAASDVYKRRLTTGVATRADGTQSAAIGGLHQSQMIEQFSEQGDAGNASDVVLGGLDHHRCHPLEGTRDDHVLDVEQQRGRVHLVGAPCARDRCCVGTYIIPGLSLIHISEPTRLGMISY